MHIIGGLIGIAFGVFLIWKTYPLVNLFGHFDWAEKYFGGGLGGTYFFYKLFGIIVIVFSALYLFGLSDNLLLPFGKFFGGAREE